MANVLALSYTWGPAVFSTEKWGPYSVKPEPTIAKAKLLIVPSGVCLGQSKDDNAAGQGSFVEESYLSEVSLTENLSDFLISLLRRAMRFSDEAIPMLWIDAICIDQTNSQEKAVQIPLMGEIYSHSAAVYIWLGKHDSDLARMFWLHDVLMPALRQRQRSLSIAAFFEWLRTFGPSVDGLPRDLALKLKHGSWADHWITYLMFYATRSWFFRAWTLQEAIVARNPVFVVGSGFKTMGWAATWDLRRVVEAWGNRLSELTISNERLDPELRSVRLVRGWTEIFPLRQEYLKYLQDESRCGWARIWTILLFIARSKECTVIQDKVYSTFGMAKMVCPARETGFPDVDLSRPTAEVFASVARFLLSSSGGLSLLSLIEDQSSRNTPGLPSWTPDFSIKGDTGHLLSSVPRFRASRDIPKEPLPRFDDKAMVFRGKRLGSIAFVPRNDDKFSYFSLQVAMVIPLLPREYASTGQSGAEALWRTLICDFTSNWPQSEGADPGLGRGFKQWFTLDLAVRLNSVNSGLDANDRSLFASVLTSDYQKAHGDLIPSLQEIHATLHSILHYRLDGYALRLQGDVGKTYYAMMAPIVQGRCLFVTDECLLGLGKQSCQVDDEIWLLAGGSVPCVLRRNEVDGTFTFIGDAYVHGVMAGERSSEGNVLEIRIT